MHSLCSTVHLTFNALNIRVPDRVASSMRMAYVVAEMNAFTTNITFSHFDTSSTSAYDTLNLLIDYKNYNEINSQHCYINRKIK